MTMLEKPKACKTIDEMTIGERCAVRYVISDDDLRKFAEVSDDWNPLHFDEDYASRSRYKRRIAHGMISVAKFSGIFGLHMPGVGAVWEAQEVRFLAPVYLNVYYTAIAEVMSLERKRAKLRTWVEDEEGNRVIEGVAWVVPISAIARRRLNGQLAGKETD
jgi:acyl dehydratase